MKQVTLYVFLLLICNIKTFGQSKQEAKIKTMVNGLYQAMIDADSIKLYKYTHEKLNYGHSSGAIDNKNVFIEKLVSGKSDFVKIDNNIESITIDKNIALIRHQLHATTNDNGKPGSVHLKILLVLKKKKGKWLLIGRQAIKV
jgi:hypothetical protein